MPAANKWFGEIGG